MWPRILNKTCTIMQLIFMLVAVAEVFIGLTTDNYVATSESMSPTIEVGDVVVLFNLAQPETLSEGDIVGYASASGVTVIHRAVREYLDPETDRLAWVTQGDANGGEDVETLTVKNIVGKCVCVVPKNDVDSYRRMFYVVYLLPILGLAGSGCVKMYALSKLSGAPDKVSGKSRK